MFKPVSAITTPAEQVCTSKRARCGMGGAHNAAGMEYKWLSILKSFSHPSIHPFSQFYANISWIIT
eukprot:354593-Chlamydomonas_euryale.AAC.4